MVWEIVLGLLIVITPIAAIILIPLVLGSIKIVTEWQKGVVLTLGKLSGVLNPGLNFVIPLIQRVIIVDMRIRTTDIPRQEVITRDNIPILVNTVVYFKVQDPVKAVIKIRDYSYAIAQYTQGALRDIIGNHELDFVLTEREKISEDLENVVDTETDEWGIDITSIKIQEIELAAEMKRAMAKQAEAERVRRGTVIISQGELQASQNLQKAAANLSKSRGALHLRTLQTVREIAADPSEKIVIVLPSDIGEGITKLLGKKK